MSGNSEKVPVSSAVPPICDELVELAILTRLPAKALMRLKCVSRKWDAFISRPSPTFIYLQSLHAPSCILRNIVVFPICLSGDPRSVGIPSIDEQMEPHMYFLGGVRIVASCNGLLCCCDDHPGMNIAIGNPSINDWKVISLKNPRSREDKDWELDPLKNICYWRDTYAFGLAVDVETSVRYTLLLLIMHNNYKPDIFVFSSTTEQWSVIRDKSVLPAGAYPDKDQVAAYVEGCLYWIVEKDQDPGLWDPKTDCGVFWFNIGHNRYGLHPLPNGSDHSMHGRLGEYGGKISYAVIKDKEGHVWSLDVWSLDHQGWSKKFSITLDNLAITYHRYQRIICFEGDLLSFCIGAMVYSLDTLAWTLDELTDDAYYGNDLVSCKNTLVPLPLDQKERKKSTF